MAETITFTSWDDLYKRMLNDMAATNWAAHWVRYGTGEEIRYSSHSEFLRMLDYVKRKRDEEVLGSQTSRRVKIRPIGRY